MRTRYCDLQSHLLDPLSHVYPFQETGSGWMVLAGAVVGRRLVQAGKQVDSGGVGCLADVSPGTGLGQSAEEEACLG